MKIHVVSFQVPWPADYGGAIDVYYKLKAMREEGFDVWLHTYFYGDRKPQPQLEKVCNRVSYYKRDIGWKKQFSTLPYIVNTRDSTQLLLDLCKDDAPILFEGLHTCFFIDHPRLSKRRKFVRMHNIEHEYYLALAQQDKWNWRALYYLIESLRLRLFEKRLKHAEAIFAITKADMQNLEKRFDNKLLKYMPVFFDAEFPTQSSKTEPFVLYHGNLNVEENQRVVKYILQKIAPQCPSTLFIIAGRNPQVAQTPNNVKIIANPTDEHLNKLIQTAQIHLMLTFQSTGIKLKLLNTLIRGNGHIIANHPMLHGHSLGCFCIPADSPQQIVDSIKQLMKQPFNPNEIEKRQRILIKMKKAGVSRLSLFK